MRVCIIVFLVFLLRAEAERSAVLNGAKRAGNLHVEGLDGALQGQEVAVAARADHAAHSSEVADATHGAQRDQTEAAASHGNIAVDKHVVSGEHSTQTNISAKVSNVASQNLSANAESFSLVEAAQALTAHAQFIPGVGLGFSLGRDLFKMLAACTIIVILLKMCGKLNCGSKRCDCRRVRCCGKCLMSSGWDEFESFFVTMTVHSIQDMKSDSLLGQKEYKVNVAFKWSNFETSPTKDMRWEQTKRIEVPQGATECVISLYSVGRFRDSKVAEQVLETKRDMLDRPAFWGEKQKLKLEHRGKPVGTLLMTFRKREDDDGGPAAAGGEPLPIAGIDPDSALALEVTKVFEEYAATPGFVCPPLPLEADMKVALLAKVLTGPLRTVSEKKGKETGQVYVRVIQCNYAELQGDDMKEEMERQKEKAKKKGIKGLEKKWYWVWYEDRKSAEHEKRWHYPDGYIPMAGITSVHRSPERADQFVLKFTEEKEKKALIYRRESGKGLDVWVDGIDLCFNECRKLIKEKKETAEKESSAMARMRQMHQQWVQKNGPPQNEEQWTKWFQWYKQNNYDDELIRKLYQEIIAPAKKR